MTTLHLVAYACEPDKGSEPGAGWNLLTEAVKYFQRVVVYTRANNAPAIQEAFTDQVDVVAVRLPPLVERWKRGQRRVRSYYLLWQMATAKELRRQLRGAPPAVVHHATFATVTIPPLSVLGTRHMDTVLIGPVGGLARVPWGVLRRHFPFGQELVREVIRDIGVLTVGRNPILGMVLKRCDQLFVQSEIDQARLRRMMPTEPQVLTNSGVAQPAPRRPDSAGERDNGRLVYAGDLKYAKGVLLLPQMLQGLPRSYRLSIYGDGPARRALELSIARCGVADRVDLVGRVSQHAVGEALARAETMILPSFREGAPAVVSEAIQAGCRVVALDVGGIGATLPVRKSGVRLISPDSRNLIGKLRKAVAEVASEPLEAAVETWAEKGARFYGSCGVGAGS